MKKKLLLLTIVSLPLLQLYSSPRSLQQARQIADQLLEKPQAVSISSSLYIYNNEEKPGFAIISGSDRVRPVIGYSETGTIDPDNMPENLTHWLQWVEEATQYLEEHPECALNESQKSSTTAITPLLGNIAWGQGYPYNAKCPNDAVVGCVATAAAQCVYYHRFPATGIGSYTDMNDATLTVNFSQVNYNYDLMFDQYSSYSTYTTAQLNEVAKLSYHCGVLCDMIYGKNGSSSSLFTLRRGLVENLGYDPHCQMIFRASHTYEEWQSYLQSELLESRPIIFAGNCNNGSEGHCFIIDGIDDKGLYHVNWGWNGYYDGYYDVTILNPDGVGTGADISDDGFCTDQEMLIQLAPKGGLTNPVYYTSITAPSGSFTLTGNSVSLGSNVTIALTNVYNYANTAVTGKFGLAFVQNGKIVKYSTYQGKAETFDAASDSKVYGGSLSNVLVQIPTSLSSGTYKVYACFIPTSGDFENECGLIYCKATTPNYYICTVANNVATFSRGTATANVTVTDWSFDSTEVSTGTTQTITCSIHNNDNTNTLVGKYYLYLTSPSSQSEYVTSEEVLTLAPGKNGTISFKKKFTEAGQWKSELYIFYQNIDYDTDTQKKAISNTTKTFTVTPDATTSAEFTLMGTPTVVSNEDYKDSLFIDAPASFCIKIKNTGEAYSGQFQMQLFKTKSATSIMGTVTGPLSIPANSEGTYTFTGNLQKISSSFTIANSGSLYYARAYFLYGDSFTKLSTTTGVTNLTPVKIFQGSPTDIENLIQEDIESSVSRDLYGRLISGHTSGWQIRNGKVILHTK